MRGQAAVELFLIASLVSLVLFWLGNYANEWSQGSVATVALEQRVLATGIARLANRAGSTGANLTHQLPCVWAGSQAIVYNVSAAGSVLTVSSIVPSASAGALLAYGASGSLAVGCNDSSTNLGGQICLNPQGSTVRLSEGACGT